MNQRTIFLISLLFLATISSVTLEVQKVEASGTIYIRADGSVDGTTDIWTDDNITYTFTSNIYDEIVVERNNIVVDGAGYAVQGTGNGTGILLLDRNNVTIKNMEIRAFDRGIIIEDSSNNTISANNVTNSEYGIVFYGSSNQNTLRLNDARDNTYNLGVFTDLVSGYIQDIDDSNTVDGKPVYYWIDRHDMTVPFDAGYVALVNCTGIIVKNLNLTNNMQGVALSFTTNSIIANNSVMNNFDGVRFDHSSNDNVISGNKITANTCYGIRLFYSSSANNSQLAGPSCNNTIYGNNVTDNGTGIRLDYSSNNTICANNVANNSDGIGLYGSSSGNTISENNITNSEYGLWFFLSFGSRIYHNNFKGNAITVYPYFDLNFWDAGHPSGGNYWGSIYHGKDIYSGLYRNETGSDGIGDTPYVEDHYPLMGMFNSYNVTYFTPTAVPHACNVTVISNSTISCFVAPVWIEHPEVVFLQFNATGPEESAGFCRVSIPTVMMNGTYHVSVNGTEIPYILLTGSDSNMSYLYFSYTHSTETIVIVPEFPSVLTLSLFMSATLIMMTIRKRNRGHRMRRCLFRKPKSVFSTA